MPNRYHVGTSTPASADAAGVMASLATLFAATLDVSDGVAVAGMTWTRDTTAGSQAIYSNAFGPRNSRIIIAVHDSGSPASGPTMVASADTYTAANILIGLVDNAAGNYQNWYLASPFYVSGGSGAGCTFAGYYRLCAVAGLNTGSIRAIVSTNDLWLQAANGNVQTAHFGAVVKGATGYQESDGYRYGGGVSGVGDMGLNWRSNAGTTAGFFGKNGTANGNAHFGVYAVGSTTWQTIRIEHIRMTPATVDMAKWAAGVGSKVALAMQYTTAPERTVGAWSGVVDGPATITGGVLNASGSGALWGWYLSSSIVTINEDSIVIARVY